MMNSMANRMSGWATSGQNMPYGRGVGGGMGFDIWHIAGAVIALIVVIAVIVIAAKFLKAYLQKQSAPAQRDNTAQEDDAVRALRLRYAQGEISHDEFAKRRAVLEGAVLSETEKTPSAGE